MGPSDPATRDIGDVVLGTGARSGRGRMPVALVVALAAHALLLLAIRRPEGGRAAKPLLQPVRMEARLYDIDVAAPAPPPVPPPERTVVERRVRALEVRARSAAPAPPPEAGRAASVVAAEPDPGAPLDLTGDTIVTGQATAYAGGVTTSAGTSASPGRVGAATTTHGAGDAVVATAFDRASPVSLESEKWSCPWPREADSEQIDEQTVILRVVVAASGVAEKATVLADPGHGFGAAAVACALKTRFVPARGRGGEAVRSTSPPIRVRFTR